MSITALALTGTAMAPAHAAPAAPSAPASSIKVEVRQARQGLAAPAAVKCKVNHIVYNRYESCTTADVELTLLRNGQPVGSATFKITHTMTLKQKSLKWSETTGISKATLVNANGVKVTYKAKCGKPCAADNKFPKDRSLGPAISGKVNYTSGVKKNKKHTTESSYTFTFTKAGFTPAVLKYKSLKYRCDDTFWNTRNDRRTLSPGCAYPSYIPTITTMANLPGISQNIKNVQSRGLKLGVPNGSVLRREADETRRNANRRAVCGGLASPGPGLSCDGYPFASTLEGGTNVPANSRGIAWVPVDEQNKQGGRIGSFYKKFRVVHADGFWVKV
ncbi:NucA/NucB deoxyribonuclease domain-containing protein [Streptomyces sp. NPDC000594]|uniref:NucA/NucB deoxyribonuclease domain-containing protein n=1 Tax=Streptomyces sp. NPDC000594 TaxID=3154261 RepID=UPI0033292679